MATSPLRWATAGLLSTVLVVLPALGQGDAVPAQSAAAQQFEQIEQANRLLRTAFELGRSGRFREAIPLARQDLAIRERLLGPEHLGAIPSRHNLGVLLLRASEFEEARLHLERVVRASERVHGPDHDLTAASLAALGRVLHMQGDLEGARPHLERAFRIHSRTTLPADRLVLTSRSNLAALLRDLGDFEGSRELLEQGIELWRVHRNEDREGVYLLTRLGDIYLRLGDLSKARSLAEEAHTLNQELWGPEHLETMTSLWLLGRVSRASGDPRDAERRFEEFTRIQERAVGPESLATASGLTALGETAMDLRDLGRALRHFERAFGIRLRELGPQHYETQRSRRHLAGVYRELGRYEVARSHYEGVLRFQERVLGPKHLETSGTRSRLGDLLEDMGELELAREQFEEVLKIREEVMGAESPTTATALHQLGGILFHLGRSDEALAHLERALTICRVALGPEYPTTLAVQRDLAAVLESRGEIARAIELTGQALEAEEKLLDTVIAGGSEQEKALFLARFKPRNQSAVSLHVRSAPDDPQALELAFRTILRRKGRALDATVKELRLAHFGADSSELLDRLRRSRSQKINLLLNPPESLELPARLARIRDLDDEIRSLWRQLTAQGVELNRPSPPVTLAEVRESIPATAALIEFFAFRPVLTQASDPAGRWGEPHYVAYVLRRTGPPRWVELGEAEAINRHVVALRKAISETRPDVRLRARELDALTLEKVRPLVGDAEMLILAPDGELQLVPFAALVDEADRYLIESFSILYQMSGRDLVRRHSEAPRRRPNGEPPLVVGGAVFDAHADSSSRRFAPLPATVEEARAIGEILDVPPSRVLIGNEATEAAVKQVQGPRILHLATHGFFLPEPSASEGEALGETLWRTNRSNPLLRSGLALSRGGRRQPAQGDDGILVALEVASLDLWGTEMAVLSACETGVGEIRMGEGVFGLRRALVLAGAKRQVMSLWQVADKPTQVLMAGWYERLMQGVSPAEAMRQAQRAALRSGTVPVADADSRSVKRLHETVDLRLAGTR
ncbi:MAG: CHAT domain-containing tetratricopeptide repeat protein, partial [Acidobacteriota bacterium]